MVYMQLILLKNSQDGPFLDVSIDTLTFFVNITQIFDKQRCLVLPDSSQKVEPCSQFLNLPIKNFLQNKMC